MNLTSQVFFLQFTRKNSPWIAKSRLWLHRADSNCSTTWPTSSPLQPASFIFNLTFPQNWLTLESSEQMCQIFWFTQFFILAGWPWNIKYQEQLWDYWSKNLPLGGGSGHLCHRVLYPPTLEPSVERRFGVALIWHQCSAYRGKTPTFWQTRR